MNADDQGQRIVAVARGWIGTPYRHQGSRKGVGCDCLGLVRGVWAEVTGEQAQDPGAYAPDWAERSGRDRLLIAARNHCGDAISLKFLGGAGVGSAYRPVFDSRVNKRTLLASLVLR